MRSPPGHVLFSSKNPTPIFDSSPTPELPLLEEASNELAGFDDFQLLPSAAVDCEHPWACASTPATTLPASPEGESSEEQASPTDLEELQGAVNFWPQGTGAFSWNHDAKPWQPQTPPEHAERRFGVADQTDSADADLQRYSDFGQGDKNNHFVLMWCRVDYEEGIMRVTPICDGTSYPPGDGAQYMNLLCYQTEILGEAAIVPCTENGFVAEGRNTVNWLPTSASEYDLKAAGYSPSNDMPCGPPTTLELSGLPDELTQDELLEILDREEFNGVYDLVYLQDNLRNESNERYALVNLVGHKYGLALSARLHNRTSWGVGDGNHRCTVTWSKSCQGFDDLVRIFKSKLEHDASAQPPQAFSDGWPIDLP